MLSKVFIQMSGHLLGQTEKVPNCWLKSTALLSLDVVRERQPEPANMDFSLISPRISGLFSYYTLPNKGPYSISNVSQPCVHLVPLGKEVQLSKERPANGSGAKWRKVRQRPQNLRGEKWEYF